MSDWDIGGDYDNWKTTPPDEEEQDDDHPSLEDRADVEYDRAREEEI